MAMAMAMAMVVAGAAATWSATVVPAPAAPRPLAAPVRARVVAAPSNATVDWVVASPQGLNAAGSPRPSIIGRQERRRRGHSRWRDGRLSLTSACRERDERER